MNGQAKVGEAERKLRILHVGNIAQNAYINAIILRRAGHDCDVAAYDWYHFASSPEWYDLFASDIDVASLGDGVFPDFYSLGRMMPEAPAWFAHGPMLNVLVYLRLRRRDDRLAGLARDALCYLRFKATMLRSASPQGLAYPEEAFDADLMRRDPSPAIATRIRAGRIYESVLSMLRASIMQFQSRAQAEQLAPPFEQGMLDAVARFDTRFASLLGELRDSGVMEALGLEWPGPAPAPRVGGADGARPDDVEPYRFFLREWRDLAARYDIVLFYGDSCIHGWLAGIDDYCALEHGTIRSIPFEDTAQGRLTRQAYLHAAKVLITNTDYLTASPRLDFSEDQRVFAIHPFDDEMADRFLADYTPRRDPARAVFLCPARQDWRSRDPKMAKGNDRYFRAARLLLDRGVGNFQLSCIAWGVDIEASRALVAELGLRDHVAWIAPLAKLGLWRACVDAAAVIDQFELSAIGGIAFETMALGRPLLIKDDGSTTTRFFGEAMPALSADTVEEIAARMQQVIDDPLDTAGVGAAGRDWIRRHHSAARLIEIEEAAFAPVAARRRARRLAAHMTTAPDPRDAKQAG